MDAQPLLEPRDEEARVTNTALVVFHTGQKGLQVGAILSPILFTAYHMGKTRSLTLPSLHTLLPRTARLSLLLSAITATMGGGRSYALPTQEEVFDRAYRIAHNHGQQRTDAFFATAAAAGALATYAVPAARPLAGAGSVLYRLGAGLLAGDLGLLAHVATARREPASRQPQGTKVV